MNKADKMMETKQKNNEVIERSQELELALLLLITNHIKKTLENEETQAIALFELRKTIKYETKRALIDMEKETQNTLKAINTKEYNDLKQKATKLVKSDYRKQVNETNKYWRKYLKSDNLRIADKKLDVFYKTFIDQNAKAIIDGTMTVEQATQQAIKQMADSGLKVIDYKSGVKRNIDVFARQQMHYAEKQSTHDLRVKFAIENNITIWEFDAHADARPSHKIWQGKRYDTTGKEYPKLEQLTHGEQNDYGCKHRAFPVWNKEDSYAYSQKELDNIDTKPFNWNGKEYDGYSATQKQRQLEREIRALKRNKILNEKNGYDTKEIDYKLRNKNAQYTSFTKSMGTYRRSERLSVKN